MVNLADGYRAAGKQEEAVASYQKAIALGFKELETNPQNADVMDVVSLFLTRRWVNQKRRKLSSRKPAESTNETLVISTIKQKYMPLAEN